MKDCMSDSVVWVDRETYAYVRGSEKALVWVDYEPGFFSRGRIIHSESVRSWVSNTGSMVRDVTADEQCTIVQAVSDHLQSKKAKVRVTA